MYLMYVIDIDICVGTTRRVYTGQKGALVDTYLARSEQLKHTHNEFYTYAGAAISTGEKVNFRWDFIILCWRKNAL